MFDKFFDRAKGYAITAVVATFLGIAGVFALTVAAAWSLATMMPWPAALAVVGVGLLAVAAIALWLGTQKKAEPEPDYSSEIDPVSMVMGLMELPVEVTKKIISERPIASVVVLGSLGFLIAKRPEVAMKLFDKVVGTFGKME